MQHSFFQPHFNRARLALHSNLQLMPADLAVYADANYGGNFDAFLDAMAAKFTGGLGLNDRYWQFSEDPQYIILAQLQQRNSLAAALKAHFKGTAADYAQMHKDALKKIDEYQREGVGKSHVVGTHFGFALVDLVGATVGATALSIIAIAVLDSKIFGLAPGIQDMHIHDQLVPAVTQLSPEQMLQYITNLDQGTQISIIISAVIGGILGAALVVRFLHVPAAHTHLSTLHIDRGVLKTFNEAVVQWVDSYESPNMSAPRIAIEPSYATIVQIAEEAAQGRRPTIARLQDAEAAMDAIKRQRDRVWANLTNIEKEDMNMLVARAQRFMDVVGVKARPHAPLPANHPGMEYVDQNSIELKISSQTTKLQPSHRRVAYAEPHRTPEGRYEISEAVPSTVADHITEAGKIGLETQVKRLKRWFFNAVGATEIAKKYAYFSEGEDQQGLVYRYHKPPVSSKELRIQHISHACELIQVHDLNILTDPVFGALMPIVYPAHTQTGVDEDEIPPIDVILISHNHRDHLDEPTLKKFVKHQPQMLVPIGDGERVRNLGFRYVREMSWYESVTLQTGDGKKVEIRATPADHWSNRTASDGGKALVNGYVIDPESERGARHDVVYFAGDTARPKQPRFEAIVDLIKRGSDSKDLHIINLQPGGPNYSRQHMQSTHQSIVDSVISHFRMACALSTLRVDQIETSIMHHNKFELGPDRFDENLRIFRKFYGLFDVQAVVDWKNSKLQAEATVREEELSDNDKVTGSGGKGVNIGHFKEMMQERENQAKYKTHGVNPDQPDDSFIYSGAIELVDMITNEENAGVLEYQDWQCELLFFEIKKELDRMNFPLIGDTLIAGGEKARELGWADRERKREELKSNAQERAQ